MYVETYETLTKLTKSTDKHQGKANNPRSCYKIVNYQIRSIKPIRSSSPWPTWICQTYFMVSRFTSQVAGGNNHHFTNFIVWKDTYNNHIHLNTEKTGCVIVEVLRFDELLCLTNTLPLTSTSFEARAANTSLAVIVIKRPPRLKQKS